MNIFKKIALINIEYLINDVEELIRLLPQFKPIYKEIIEIVKEVF